MSKLRARKQPRLIFCFMLLLLVSLSSAASNASDDTMVTLDISPKTVYVGDVITLDIFIKHLKGFSLYLPDTIDLGQFDIIDTKIVDLKKDGVTFSRATFKIAIYKVGVFSIPNINLLLRSENKRIEVVTPERKLEVVSTLKPDGNALLDIYPPLQIKQSYLKFLVYVWIISLLLVIGAVLHFRKKKRENKAAIMVRPKVRVDPKKAALELLNKIFTDENLSKLSDKEICENVSFTVKYYIKEKFDVGSLEMTSKELINCLDDISIGGDYLNGLYKLLMSCDLVKFANYELKREASQDDVRDIRNAALAIIG